MAAFNGILGIALLFLTVERGLHGVPSQAALAACASNAAFFLAGLNLRLGRASKTFRDN